MRPILALALLVLATPVFAQGVTTGASSRATAFMDLNPPRVQGDTARPRPKRVSIEYGVPHVRGRSGLPAELVADNTVWRTGANSSTTFTTDADLTIGGANVPAGRYSLYTIRQGSQYFLIINHNTGQWGTEYDATKDLVRVPMTHRALSTVQESLQYAWIPAANPPARGALRITWATTELSVEWTAR